MSKLPDSIPESNFTILEQFARAARKQRKALDSGLWGHAVFCNFQFGEPIRCNCGVSDLQSALKQLDAQQANVPV